MENIYVNVETASEDETSNTSGLIKELFTDVNLLNKILRNNIYDKKIHCCTKSKPDVLIEHSVAFTSSQKFFYSGSTPSLSYL